MFDRMFGIFLNYNMEVNVIVFSVFLINSNLKGIVTRETVQVLGHHILI